MATAALRCRSLGQAARCGRSWRPRVKLATACPVGCAQAPRVGQFWHVGHLAGPPSDGKSGCAVAAASCEQCCRRGSALLLVQSPERVPKQPGGAGGGWLADGLHGLGKVPQRRLPRRHRYRGEKGRSVSGTCGEKAGFPCGRRSPGEAPEIPGGSAAAQPGHE